MKKGIIAFIMVMIMILPASPVYAADPFTSSIKADFYAHIVWAHANDWKEYNRFTLHDFDGDNIPEILYGVTNESNSWYVRYEVVKYSNGDFKRIGELKYSRYLMKDKYSHAVIGLYGDKDINETALDNFYIHNGTIQTNNILTTSSNGHKKNNVTITAEAAKTELFNYFATYEELMVHDNYSDPVVLAAIYTWKPVTMAAGFANKLSSTTVLTKDWQIKYEAFISTMTGPANTYSAPYEVPSYANAEYTRYALHDFNNDTIPELLIGVKRNEQLCFDVYRYIKGDVNFIGSFDAYSKYISKYPKSNDIYSFDPINDLFNYQAVNKIFLKDNSLQKEALMEVYTPETQPSKVIYEVGGKITNKTNYTNKLITNFNANKEIKTYDIKFVPASAIVSGWRGN